MIRIDKKTHKIDERNYIKSNYDKRQIIISFSLRKNNYHVLRLKHKKIGQNKEWNTYTISREGIIFEHFTPQNYSKYFNNPDADKHSIHIVLENMCGLNKTENNIYINNLNEVCYKKNVKFKRWLGGKYWEDCSNKQLKQTAELCKNLCEKFNIPLKTIEFHHKHNQVFDFNGITFKSNYFEHAGDINPFFNIENFNKLLNK